MISYTQQRRAHYYQNCKNGRGQGCGPYISPTAHPFFKMALLLCISLMVDFSRSFYGFCIGLKIKLKF